ncbi:MAG: hypothetical protein KJZ84_23015 [Bryobacteraceae bacterium]|nr:hypothetical protein [Bryobacteraceae bacterium]
MIRFFIALLALALPAAAQLREVTIEIQPTECVSCTESLPARMQRVRGVAHANMREAPARVVIELEADNRVRLTRLLDVVRQDGTGITAVAVHAAGEVFDEGGWRFRILPGDQSLEWRGPAPAKPGKIALEGRILPPFDAISVEKTEVQP